MAKSLSAFFVMYLENLNKNMDSIIAAIIGGLFTVYAAKIRLDDKTKENQTSGNGRDRGTGATKYDLVIFVLELIVLILFVYFVYYKFFWQLILQPLIKYFS